MEKQQKMRYTDKELDLMKFTFKDDLSTLKAIRKVFLQMELTEKEYILLRRKIKGDVIPLMRKVFLPELDGDAPISQIIDLWMTIKIDDKNPDEAMLFIKAREIVVNYIEQQLAILGKETNEEKIKFKSLSEILVDNANTYINFLARNTIILHTENQIQEINILSHKIEETPEEEAERLKKDSSK